MQIKASKALVANTHYASALYFQKKRFPILKTHVEALLKTTPPAKNTTLIVHIKDEKTRMFYEQFGFESLPEHLLHLALLLKDARLSL